MGNNLPWLVLTIAAITLLSWFSPVHEATGAHVAPLAAGLVAALGALALMGWLAMPAVVVGAALSSLGWPIAPPDAMDVWTACTLVAQAALGCTLLRSSRGAEDLALDSRPAIRRLVAAALGCGVLGGLSHVLGDLMFSADPTLRPGALFMVRAVADAGSVVIGLPLLLAFAPSLRERWLPRRTIVALPLLVLIGLMLVAFTLINERDRQHAQSRFERDSEVVFARTQSLLDAPVQTLLALRGAFQVAGGPLPAGHFDSLLQPWLRRALGVGSVGWLDLAAVPAPALTAVLPSQATPGSANPLTTMPQIQRVLGSLPLLSHNPDSGQSARSVLELPALRQLAQRASGQDGPVVSAPFALGTAPDIRPGFLVMQSLPTVGAAGFRSLAFATVSADALVAPVLASRDDAMRACLYDTDPRTEPRRLAGPQGCELATAADGGFSREAQFDYGGRRWAMRVTQPVRTAGGLWLFAVPALAGGALLAVLLVGMTGQVQRVRHEARSRTDELRHEIELHARDLVLHDRTVSAMLDTVQIGIAVLDPDGRIERVNKAFADLAGTRAEGLRHQPIDDVLVDAERPTHERFSRLIQEADDDLIHQSLRLRNAEGRVTPSLVTLRVLRDEQSRAMSAVCAVHDLSESLRRRQVEKVLGNVMELRGDTMPAPLDDEPRGTGITMKRLLCIGAGGDLADTVRSAVAHRDHINVLAAHGGPEGMLIARREAPHLVLLDLDLPDADGMALMRRLTQEGFLVVAMAVNMSPMRIDDAFASGARAYLSLPVDERELVATIDDLV